MSFIFNKLIPIFSMWATLERQVCAIHSNFLHRRSLFQKCQKCCGCARLAKHVHRRSTFDHKVFMWFKACICQAYKVFLQKIKLY